MPLSITAANVRPATGKVQDGLSSEAIVAGKAVAKIPSTGLWALADANAAGQASCTEYGIAANSAPGANQPLRINQGGTMVADGFTSGVPVFVGPTAGDVVVLADVSAGCRAICLGIPTSATVLNMGSGPIIGGTV